MNNNYKSIDKNKNYKTSANSSKKNKYLKFLNVNNIETERKKNNYGGYLNNKNNFISKNIKNKGKQTNNKKNSYAQIIKKNILYDLKKEKKIMIILIYSQKIFINITIQV